MPRKSIPLRISHQDAQIIVQEIDKVAWDVKCIFAGLDAAKKTKAIELGHSLANLKSKLEPYL